MGLGFVNARPFSVIIPVVLKKLRFVLFRYALLFVMLSLAREISSVPLSCISGIIAMLPFGVWNVVFV